MYKTIEANYKNVSIVTELAQMSAIAFIINESGQKDSEQANYFASKPFAAGEIFVGSLLNSLMCQAFYNPKMTDLLDQFIMGSASTSAEVYKLYQKMNLAMCSLNIMEVPKGCQDMTYASLFEFCVKRNQVPIGVFRRHNDDEFAQNTRTIPVNQSRMFGCTHQRTLSYPCTTSCSFFARRIRKVKPP
jgi:hypothetical protein